MVNDCMRVMNLTGAGTGMPIGSRKNTIEARREEGQWTSVTSWMRWNKCLPRWTSRRSVLMPTSDSKTYIVNDQPTEIDALDFTPCKAVTRATKFGMRHVESNGGFEY